MKIALAQIQTIKGNISENIKNHHKFIQMAVEEGADLILFPELSITGYEPDLAATLARFHDDELFDQFQEISNTQSIIIGVGMPIRNEDGIAISLLIFQPHSPKQVYAKQHLHADEMPFFIAGQNETTFIKETTISLAICYEIFIESHVLKAQEKGATIYLASVAKSENGLKKAYKRLPKVAKAYKLLVLMSNSIGYCDNFEAAGQSAAWDIDGNLMGQLEGDKEGLLVIDTVLI